MSVHESIGYAEKWIHVEAFSLVRYLSGVCGVLYRIQPVGAVGDQALQGAQINDRLRALASHDQVVFPRRFQTFEAANGKSHHGHESCRVHHQGR